MLCILIVCDECDREERRPLTEPLASIRARPPYLGSLFVDWSERFAEPIARDPRGYGYSQGSQPNGPAEQICPRCRRRQEREREREEQKHLAEGKEGKR